MPANRSEAHPPKKRQRTAASDAGCDDAASSTCAIAGVELPKSFCCSLTLELMRDPVSTADGHTYERAAIARWFAQGKTTSPNTGAALKHQNLIPNIALRQTIEEWADKNNARHLLVPPPPSATPEPRSRHGDSESSTIEARAVEELNGLIDTAVDAWAAARQPPSLEAGQRVVLYGLKRAVQLNGREGVLHGAADTATGRWEVRLVSSGAEEAKAVRVKAANLRPTTAGGGQGQGPISRAEAERFAQHARDYQAHVMRQATGQVRLTREELERSVQLGDEYLVERNSFYSRLRNFGCLFDPDSD